jgi:hypothetical protein
MPLFVFVVCANIMLFLCVIFFGVVGWDCIYISGGVLMFIMASAKINISNAKSFTYSEHNVKLHGQGSNRDGVS